LKKLFFIVIVFAGLHSFSQTALSVSFTKVNESCLKGKAYVNISGGTSPYKINWSTGDSNIVSIKDLVEGSYSVVVKDAANKDTLINFSIVNEGCLVSVSNHFTPNDDGYNDTWYILHLEFYPEFELFVYNRSGQLVHHQTETYIPWNGTWLGTKVPDATYYYVLYLNKKEKHEFLKGDLTILR
jgi:gliding motility-associated-like protein